MALRSDDTPLAEDVFDDTDGNRQLCETVRANVPEELDNVSVKEEDTLNIYNGE
jgi:hypothetical protein